MRKLEIPLVSGSFKKTSKQSMKLVPLNGSPPIPENIQGEELKKMSIGKEETRLLTKNKMMNEI